MSISGLSKARLARMHDVMAGYVERGEVPGLVTLVSRRGEVHVDLIGTQAFGESSPMRRDTIFRISSMTKPIIAVATMILVEECKVRLDEPVDTLLPELAERQVLKRLDGPLDDTVVSFAIDHGARPAHVPAWASGRSWDYQMLTRFSRLPMSSNLAWDLRIDRTCPAPDEWMRRLGQLPLMHQPGEQWMYHTGSDVLGVLIARVSGQPLERFLRERIFAPLQHGGTGFSVPEPSLDRFVTELLERSSQVGNSSCMTQPEAVNGATRLLSRREREDWFRPSMTIWPLVR